MDNTTAKEDSKHNFDVAIEPEAEGFKAWKIGYSYEANRSHEQRYFSQGLAGRHFIQKGSARGIPFKVWWNLQHNFSQNSSVPPNFRTAILVTRRIEAANSKFIAHFDIAVRGGFGMALEEMVNFFLRRNVKTRPILFDPSIKLMGTKLDGIEVNGEGEYELGHLAGGNELVELSQVWGLTPLPQT